ncbi:OmpA family protein [Geofilum sp. OHC36d9]|uniref:OmpA family protein n=1 Tax=Geofilum sp. OHC36d9 TaxID=3458413 RepID=UPI0040339C63
MRPTYHSILILVMVFLPVLATGQSSMYRRANTQFDRGEYYEALQIFNEIVEDGYELDPESKLKVGHCYYQLNNVDEAFNYFMEQEDKLSGYDLYVYALINHKIGFYEGAIDLYRKARPQNPERQGQIDELIRSCEWAMNNQEFLPVRVNPSSIMTFGQSFGVQYYKDGIVYSSASPEKEGGKKDRQGRNFLSLYYSDLDGDNLKNTRVFSRNLVFDYHVGAISFSPDEKAMYYTRTVRVKGGDNKLKIFSVVFDGSDWVDDIDLNINSNDYDNAHPAVTPDGKSLIFVSNRPGGYGGKDLWMADIKPNRTLTNVRNLGPKINSFGDELFPFVSTDNILYFSSDGHVGFGGLDLYRSKNENGVWSAAENMMQPFNSYKDDFGYVINPKDKNRGFLSTNRTGEGNDGIFYVQYREEESEPEAKSTAPVIGLLPETVVDTVTIPEVVPVEEVKVDLSIFPDSFASVVTSSFNGNAIQGANINLTDPVTGKQIGVITSGSNGRFEVPIPDAYRKEGQDIHIAVSKDEFKTYTLDANIMELKEVGKAGILLAPIFKEPDLNEISGLVIPYEGNTITADGYRKLDQVAAYLLNNPQVVIKLNGHTDARGNMITNLNTSQSIAEAAGKYLESKGVSESNYIPRGYGERYILNKCRRGKLCDKAEHLQNRRIEVVVWRFKN